MFEKVRDAIYRYEPYATQMIWMSLFSFFLPENGLLVINYGNSSVGKSHGTLELAEWLKMYYDDVNKDGTYASPVIKGPNDITATMMYRFLKMYSSKVIIFNDFGPISQDRGIKTLIKDCFDESRMIGRMTNLTKTDGLVKMFSSMIINTNYNDLTDSEDSDIKTRAFENFFYPDGKTIEAKEIHIRKYMKDGGPQQDIDQWLWIKSRIESRLKIIQGRFSNAVKNGIPLDDKLLRTEELNKTEEERVQKIIDGIPFTPFDQDKIFNRRNVNKYKNIARLFKMVFGEINDNCWEEIGKMIFYYAKSGIVNTNDIVVQKTQELATYYDSPLVSKGLLLELIMRQFQGKPKKELQTWIESALEQKKIEESVDKKYIKMCGQFTFGNIK